MIDVNGHQFMTLADPIYINGTRVHRIFANGEQVYPCLPYAIEVVLPPIKVFYKASETLDYTGLKVRAVNKDGSPWVSLDYPDGIIPFEELILPEKYAPYYGLYTLPGGEITVGGQSFYGPATAKCYGIVDVNTETGRRVYSFQDAINYGWATYMGTVGEERMGGKTKEVEFALCNVNNCTLNNSANSNVYFVVIENGNYILHCSTNNFPMSDNMAVPDSDWCAWAWGTNLGLYHGHSGSSWNNNQRYTYDGKTAYYSVGYQPYPGELSWIVPITNISRDAAGALAWYILYGGGSLETDVFKHIPVKWARPDDEKILETSFMITKEKTIQ